MITDYHQQEYRHPILIEILDWLHKTTGLEFVETCSFRMFDDGVHGTLPVRASDLRCWSREIGLAIEALINKNWTYDHNREHLKCCLLHGDGSNLHLHIQVHPNTEKK